MPTAVAKDAGGSRSRPTRSSAPSRVARESGRAVVRKRAEFERIQKSGERVDTQRFVLILARQETPGRVRLGVTASRRIGNAVARNRAKRLVREAFRQTLDLFPEGLDLVVIVRKPLGEARLSDVVREWRAVKGSVRKQAVALLGLARGPAGSNNPTHPKGS